MWYITVDPTSIDPPVDPMSQVLPSECTDYQLRPKTNPRIRLDRWPLGVKKRWTRGTKWTRIVSYYRSEVPSLSPSTVRVWSEGGVRRLLSLSVDVRSKFSFSLLEVESYTSRRTRMTLLLNNSLLKTLDGVRRETGLFKCKKSSRFIWERGCALGDFRGRKIVIEFQILE